MAHLIGERGVSASHILAVTFINKAAGEMRERLVHILGDGAVPWVSTFHSTCVRILRIEAERLGFGKNFVIYDDRDQERLLKECLHDLHIPEQQYGLSAFSDALSRLADGLRVHDRPAGFP